MPRKNWYARWMPAWTAVDSSKVFMKYSALVKDIRAAFPDLDLREHEPMRAHCSFRVGGPAAAMALPGSTHALEALCAHLRRAGVRPLVIGNGTNILPPDGDLDRFVIVTCPGAGQVTVSNETVTADCGASLSAVAAAAAMAGLTGLEFAHGIPGSVGGGVMMNAGAYGGELKDAAVETEYLDEELVCRTARGPEQGFSYRHSAFSGREVVLLRTRFLLRSGEREVIRARMNELAARRRASQPLELPSAGSTFKRPPGGYAAALIDQAGLKGFSIGGAMVSEKHAGFVVNTGSATAADILRLMEHVQTTVLARSHVALEPEILILEG